MLSSSANFSLSWAIFCSSRPGQKKGKKVTLKTFHIIQQKCYSFYSCPRCGIVCVCEGQYMCVLEQSSVRERWCLITELYTHCSNTHTYTHELKIVTVHKNVCVMVGYYSHASAAYTWSRTEGWGCQWWTISLWSVTYTLFHQRLYSQCEMDIKRGKHHARL